MSEKYWEQQAFERATAPRVPCVGDLERIATRNPVVRAFLASWKMGALTFEQMACGLVCELAAQNDRFQEFRLRHDQMNVSPMILYADGVDGADLRTGAFPEEPPK